MLNIRNLIFALSLSPLIFAAWQLPSQAGGNPNAAESGGNPGGSTNTIFSVPPTPTTGGGTTGGGTTGGGITPPVTTVGGQTITIPIISGVSPAITTGVSTTGTLSAVSTTGDATTALPTITVSAATVEPTSPGITVTNGATANTIVITLSPQVQVTVNQVAAAITQALSTTGGGTTGGGTTGGGTTGGGSAANVGSLLTGGAGSQQVAVALTNSFTAAGISPQLATALVTSLTGLFGSTQGSLPNQPLAQATSGQLVASTKAFKPVYVIAQSGAGVSVNINKLNDAIVAYNGIILNSEPKALKNISRNTGFVGIGGILKQLRTAIK